MSAAWGGADALVRTSPPAWAFSTTRLSSARFRRPGARWAASHVTLLRALLRCSSSQRGRRLFLAEEPGVGLSWPSYRPSWASMTICGGPAQAQVRVQFSWRRCCTTWLPHRCRPHPFGEAIALGWAGMPFKLLWMWA